MRYLLFFVLVVLIFNLKPTKLADVSKFVNEEITIEVSGHLTNSGIYTLNNLATFADLLPMLELHADSDVSHYALNKRLVNNDLIIVNKISEQPKISINTADVDQLITLKGIGIKIAQRIIDYRDEFGAFKELEDLMYVKGIGEKVFSNIKDFITL